MPRRPRRRLDARPRSVPSHIDLAALDSTRSTVTSEPPLLLLPLRLEYRIVKPHSRPEMVDLSATINALRELDRGAGGSTPRHRRARDAAAALVRSAAMSAPLIVRPAVSIGAVQIWFRWYPDDGFARKGIEPASDAELRSLEAFRARVATRPVFDLQDPETAAAWTDLAAGLGADRALHLVRQVSPSGGARSPEAIGAIAALPHAVSLFALKGETIELLGTGGPIPPNTASERSVVSYTPEALEPGGWLRDFPVAEERGMAMKLTEPAAVARALDADFIVAVGRSGADGHAEMEALVRDGIANGTFGIVRQDTPTNNNSGARTTTADPLRDLQRFFDEAAMDERGAVPGNGSAAADVLADALGIDRVALRKARHAGDTPAADARAMLRVIGPALLDGALDGVTAVAGVDENTFVEILAGVASARGQVPVVRFGQNPYGVLPISPVADLDTGDGDAKTARVYEFLAQYSRIVRALLPVQADQSVVVLEPNDPHAAAKLEEMLKSNRVSTRIVVGNEAETSTASLGCGYVVGPRPEDQPGAYLRDLAQKPPLSLPDPTETDTETPLLYRLARLSLISNIVNTVLTDLHVQPLPSAERPRPSAAPEVDDRVRAALERSGLLGRTVGEMAALQGGAGIRRPALGFLRNVQKTFGDALAHLRTIAARPDGTAELEMLLLETIDLLQHRVDAYAMGLAYSRLAKLRRGGVQGLAAGYYGLVGRLRDASVTGRSNGYLQAPSMAQATTAAVLRSAYLRQAGSGAFELDLSSRRVRRALALLDILKQGISLEEALGLRGERWLHEQKLSRLTLDLRQHFPIVNTAPDPADSDSAPREAGMRVFNGTSFLAGDLTAFDADDHPHLEHLKRILREELDALADLVVAEAAHQRAMGLAEAAKAWLSVLSGGTIPGPPQFVRTQRSAQGSTYRLSFLLQQTAPEVGATPREIAEPALAQLARASLPDLAAVRARLTVERVDDPPRFRTLDISLAGDLGMHALDLVIGGRSELEVRARHHVVSRWLRDPAVSDALGPLPPDGIVPFLNVSVRIAIGEATAGSSLGTAVQRAIALRTLVQSGRMLEPADLNAAASPASPLDEPTEVTLIHDGVALLRSRANTLKTHIDAALSALTAAREAFLQVIRPIRLALDAGGTQSPTEAELVSAEMARRSLEDARVSIAAYAEPAALLVFTLDEAIADPDAIEERMRAIETRVTARAARLANAIASTAVAPPAVLDEARVLRRRFIEALQSALDGEALPILAPFSRIAATSPLVDAAQNVESAVAPWRAVRRAVARSANIAAALPGFSAFPVSADATAANTGDENQDPREESDAPLSRHFGVFFSASPTLAGPGFAGFVTDEWTEQRPSRTHSAGLAVNYDSPQAEAPQCLLLCVPPHANAAPWSDAAAARMVAETIAWMKIRAMNTDQKPWPAAVLPNANQVPSKQGTPRIPKRRFRGLDFDVDIVEGAFAVRTALDGDRTWGAAKTELNERIGFHRVKE